jgi:hypothetical protein
LPLKRCTQGSMSVTGMKSVRAAICSNMHRLGGWY